MVYSKILSHDFIHLDDGLHIYSNPLLSPISPSNLKKMWSAPYESLYIPLSYTVFAILSLIAHTELPAATLTDTGTMLNPHCFHAASLVVHCVNALLVFMLLTRLIKRQIPALFGALVWALHPVQTESIAWASELRGLLSATFSLLALLTYPYNHAPDSKPHLRLAGTILLGICGMLCKPSAITSPFFAFVLDLIIFQTRPRQAIIYPAVWLACLLPFALITHSAQAVQLPGPLYEPPIYLRPIIALDAIGFYLTKLFAFLPLCADYGRTPFHVLHSRSTVWHCALALLFLISLQFTSRKTPTIFASQLLYLSAILPVLGFTPFIFQYFSTVSDRYLYLAMLGPALIVAWLVNERPSVATKSIAAVLCTVLGVATLIQTGYWKDTDTFALHILDVNHRSAAAVKLLGDDAKARGDYSSAVAYYQREITYAPQDFRGYSDLGNVKLIIKSPAQALPLLIKAAEMRPDLSMNLGNLGIAYLMLGQFDKSNSALQRAVKLSPTAATPLFQLAKLEEALQDDSSAIEHLQKAIELEPQYHESYELLGQILVRRNRLTEALATYQKESQYDPGSAVAFCNVGILLNQLGQSKQAEPYLEQAIKLAPSYADARLTYGEILGQQGDMPGAVAQFEAVLQTNPLNRSARQDLTTALNMQNQGHN